MLEQSSPSTKPHYSLLITPQLSLRPYLKQHVTLYNSWMSNPTLCHLTSSQHLTLSQQYECQLLWTTDPTRDTFLIFHQSTPIGDVNVFFSEWLQENECEINVMIAEEWYRGMGVAGKAVGVMEEYGSAKGGRNVMIARIKEGNNSSVKLFKKLGYQEVGFNEKEREHQFRKKLEKVTWEEFVDKYNVKSETIQ